jgi:hypothetical protein
MIVKDLDGNTLNWHLTGNLAHARISAKSSLHLRARKLLSLIFPTLQVLEEVPIQLRKSETLYLDFYCPLIKTCVEVHGEQHYKFVSHYHSSKLGFLKSQKRDREKIEWCHINNIKHIELPFDEDDSGWTQRIKNEQ